MVGHWEEMRVGMTAAPKDSPMVVKMEDEWVDSMAAQTESS